MHYVNHPDVARFRGVNPQYSYSLGGISGGYYGSGYGGYQGMNYQGMNYQGMNYQRSPRTVPVALMDPGQVGRCQYPTQIICADGSCVSTITACPEFTWSQYGNRFRNPPPKYYFSPRGSGARKTKKRRRNPARYPSTVIGTVFKSFGVKMR